MGFINIRSHKNLIDQTLPLNEKACVTIKDYLIVRPDSDSDILFLNRFRQPLGERGIQKLVQKYLDQAGIDGASVQSLRYTFGAHHAAKGTSIKTIQAALGHRDL